MSRTAIPLFVIFFIHCIGCLASAVMFEKGSSVCINFTKKTMLEEYAIRRNNSNVCVSPGINIPPNKTPWGNKTINCSITTNMVSICFGDFQLQDTGLFSYCKDSSTSHECYENITLKMIVPVVSVTLSPTQISVTAEGQMNLFCTTSKCFPPANITWYTSSIMITNMTTSTTYGPDGLATTNSWLQSTVEEEDNQKQVNCRASNIPGQIIDSTIHTINVKFKPRVKSNVSRPYYVLEGQTATLKCTVIAANPNTSLQWIWYKTNSSSILEENTYIIYEITRKESGSYGCAANNSVGTSETAEIVVDVQYKPDVKAELSSPYPILEGNKAILKCIITDYNPKTIIAWKWFKTDNSDYELSNESAYLISNTSRRDKGSYNCTASNSVGTSIAATLYLDVQYKPDVTSSGPSSFSVKENETATLKCTLNDANPNSHITWRWFKTDSPNITLNNSGSTYVINYIKRYMSGSYGCAARNSVAESKEATINVSVQYKPEIEQKPSTIVNESDKVILTREIVSNPSSDVYWYYRSELLVTQSSTKNATLIIEKAMCTDTKNFTLVASNTVEKNVTALVELRVNCKPQSYDTNITLGVTGTTGIKFKTTVIAYPEPDYELKYLNGTRNIHIGDTFIRNSVNNFTLYFNQTIVYEEDYGTYYLTISNAYGETNVSVNILPQQKPNKPTQIKISCEVRSARIQWMPSFNGGDPQTFTAVALNGQQKISESGTVSDKEDSGIHSVFIQNLQPSTEYVFYVSAQNRHGFSLSENVSCTTEEFSDYMPIIAGGAAAGGIAMAIIVIVGVLMFRRYTSHEKRAGKSIRFENNLVENDNSDDDGLKDNILYVSAGPKDDKPEAAVYATVQKNEPENNNNARRFAQSKKCEKTGEVEGATYSEVKPKKGFFKKAVKGEKGEKPKQNKDKKQKGKLEVADVYENSDDIAMTSGVDILYSNADQNNQFKKEERGFKNKDGLLYVEVQFEANTDKENPVIHGEDEKTDYATVEFPVVSSLDNGKKCNWMSNDQ